MAKILLADDSGTAQRMGAQILTAEGHEVTTVSNGQAAIKMLSKFSPDLIVADVFMPGKSGYELCEYVKSNPDSAWIPVLLIVAPMEPYDATEGHRVKADGLVTKPLDKSNLVETVQALLAAAKKQQASPPKKRGAAKVAAVEKREPPKPVESVEAPVEEDSTIPSITTPAPVEFAIPEEIRNQPVSLIGDLLAPPVAQTEPSVEEGRAAELPPAELAPLEIVGREASSETMQDPLFVTGSEPVQPERDPLLVAGSESVEPAGISHLFAAAESSSVETPFAAEPETVIPTVSNQEFAAAASRPSWTAEVAEVTGEDRKLFEPEPPSWQGLMDMVQKADEQSQFPATSSAAAVAEPAAQPSIESSPPEEPETSSASANPPGEPEGTPPPAETAAPAPAPAVVEKPALLSDAISMPLPKIAPLDYATVAQIVRETIEEVMPQIVGRIEQATGLQFQKKDQKEE